MPRYGAKIGVLKEPTRLTLDTRTNKQYLQDPNDEEVKDEPNINADIYTRIPPMASLLHTKLVVI